MRTTSMGAVERFLAQPAFALAGASRTGEKFGNVILRELLAKGMHVYPLNPGTTSIDGCGPTRT